MASVDELRVYYSKEEMINGMSKFVGNPEAYLRWGRGVVTIDGWYTIQFMTQNHSLGNDWIKGVPMRIAGLQLRRVWCDVRVPMEVIRYCMARMRHPTLDVDNHIKVFHGIIRE